MRQAPGRDSVALATGIPLSSPPSHARQASPPRQQSHRLYLDSVLELLALCSHDTPDREKQTATHPRPAPHSSDAPPSRGWHGART